MSEFTELNWKKALTDLYLKSLLDPVFRQLCLTDPRAAVKEVSDIELPPEAKLQFFDNRADYVYAFLLPPLPDGQAPVTDQLHGIIEWSTICTDYTTTITGQP